MIFPCRYVFESYDYFQTKATSAAPRLLFARTFCCLMAVMRSTVAEKSRTTSSPCVEKDDSAYPFAFFLCFPSFIPRIMRSFPSLRWDRSGNMCGFPPDADGESDTCASTGAVGSSAYPEEASPCFFDTAVARWGRSPRRRKRYDDDR